MLLKYYSLYAVLFLIVNLSGCSFLEQYKTPTNESVKFDPTLIRDYTQTLEYQESQRAPFITSYHYGDKFLVIVASQHADGAGSPTHLSIEKAFGDNPPAFLLVEGSAFTIVSDPDDVNYAKECLKKNFRYCGVDAFAVSLALKSNTPFSYGDPSDAGVHSALKKKGLTDDELIVFYALKNIPQKKLSVALAESSKKLRAKKTMSESTFKKIYKNKMGQVFNIKNISHHSSWLSNTAEAIDTLRDQFFTRQMEARLNKYKKLLVVIHSSRLVKLRVMLNSALGESSDVKAL